MATLYRLVAAVAGTGVLSTVVLTQKDRFKLHASSSNHGYPETGREDEGAQPKVKYNWNDNWDHRSPKAYTKARKKEGGAKDDDPVPVPTASRHLILIRHGQYELWHEKSELKILTELGRRQAAITGERLKELQQVDKPYSMLYYSTMPRATETAMVISESLPGVAMQSCDLLREGAPIRPDPPHKTWKPEEYEFFRDSVRIEAAFRKYFHRASPSQKEDTTDILVCHANVIRYFICRALQLPPEAWLRISLAHGSITRVTIRPNGRVGVKSLGSADHMPAKLVTFQ